MIRDAELLSAALARPQASALLILVLNGVRLTAGDEELFALTMTMASGELRDVPLIAGQLEAGPCHSRAGITYEPSRIG